MKWVVWDDCQQISLHTEQHAESQEQNKPNTTVHRCIQLCVSPQFDDALALLSLSSQELQPSNPKDNFWSILAKQNFCRKNVCKFPPSRPWIKSCSTFSLLLSSWLTLCSQLCCCFYSGEITSYPLKWKTTAIGFSSALKIHLNWNKKFCCCRRAFVTCIFFFLTIHIHVLCIMYFPFRHLRRTHFNI